MSKAFAFNRPSLSSLLIGANALLVIVYVTLIAVVMSYAALEVEFAQSVRTDESVVAKREAAYLAEVGQITSMDYLAAGYQKPSAEHFVAGVGDTALRTR